MRDCGDRDASGERPAPGSPALRLPLHTERLTLRLFTPADLDDRYAYQRLPEVARYLFRPPHSRESCARFLADGARQPAWDVDGQKLNLAITRTAITRTAVTRTAVTRTAVTGGVRDGAPTGGEPEVIGEVMVKIDDVRAQQVELGWMIHPDHGGRGYATEAARAAAVAAFDHLDAHRVFARLDTENAASVRVCERLGMRREAHLMENDVDGTGRRASEYVYAALLTDLIR